ncbi:hypothetical protein D3C71_2075150 [compost metagenome]
MFSKTWISSEAGALVEAAKRVRNNLSHGGKEDSGEQPFDGDDNGHWPLSAFCRKTPCGQDRSFAMPS